MRMSGITGNMSGITSLRSGYAALAQRHMFLVMPDISKPLWPGQSELSHHEKTIAAVPQPPLPKIPHPVCASDDGGMFSLANAAGLVRPATGSARAALRIRTESAWP